MDDPILYYTPTFAPAGISFYTGNRYPGWRNTSLLVGGLRGEALRRLDIKDRRVLGQDVLFNQFGRVRDIVQAPDGYIDGALQVPRVWRTPPEVISRCPRRRPVASCG